LDLLQNKGTPLISAIYVQKSFNTIEELKRMHIPENALLFSADAISMYTNIDPNQVSLQSGISTNLMETKSPTISQTVYFYKY
jgi:hypothetical protein